jgi:DNA-binding transcriptional LysR family regulator
MGDTFGLTIAAAAAAIAYVREPCVAPLTAQRLLRIVLDNWASIGPGFHIYFPGRRQLPTGLRLLIDLMQPLGI